ncbi:MAG: hypothetical protein EHM33_02220 [Chloroflexi bacterium]|nr:MAG: hypothetical protein EHM33_02220 [Chloroflexota bacterium]
MMKIGPMHSQSNQKVKIAILFLALLFLWLGLNYRQLYSAWAITTETRRLVNLAAHDTGEFQNPPAVEDRFDGRLSSDFWKFTSINGAGKASRELAWHSAAIVFDHSLTIQHFPDPSFREESPVRHKPAADQYNNVSFIGGFGFRPSRSRDVVLKFTSQVDEEFYGTAGVVFQPAGTIQEDGLIVKPFDMFGFSVTGEETSITGINGPLCYLALNWIPAQVEPLQVDTQSLHAYEVRLRWISQTEWLGIVKIDGTTQCQIPMPSFGPVEVHVWSDNSLVLHRPRRWWEIGPAMDLKYQDGGDKQFSLGMIQIFEEAR